MSLVHWILLAATVVVGNLIFLIPIAKILRRAGLSGWWALLFFGGPFMIVGLWTFAFCHWPTLDLLEDHRR